MKKWYGTNCMKNNCSLTPRSDSRGSALTRTAGIPSSINILFLMASVSREREKRERHKKKLLRVTPLTFSPTESALACSEQ